MNSPVVTRAYLVEARDVAKSFGQTPAWIWPARPPHDLGGAICACLVIAAGLMLITVRGPRESGRESGSAS